ncbi:MAG: transcriptional regulator, partial [Asticcacaulis sp.]
MSVDLTREMADLMSALGRPQGRRGRVLLFASACSGEGVSTVAREYARCEAAFARRPVWLVDADLGAQTQMIALGQDPRRFGPPGKLSKASPDGSVFFRVSPQGRDASG